MFLKRKYARIRYLKFYFYKNVYEGKDTGTYALRMTLTSTPCPALLTSLKDQESSSFAYLSLGHISAAILKPRPTDTLQHPHIYLYWPQTAVFLCQSWKSKFPAHHRIWLLEMQKLELIPSPQLVVLL